MQNPLHKTSKGSPKDFFLWVGVMATLYISATSLVLLLFEYIRILFPDDQDFYYDPYRAGIRSAIASLIVLFPLYVYLTRKINTEIRKEKNKGELRVRKWIVYLTLFFAGVTIVVDLIVLIDTFLGGEHTTQFILKVLTVLLVIGGGFLYYYYDLKGYWRKHESKSKLVGAIASLIVIVSIVSGFFIMGSPATQRLLRYDQEKVDNLSSIQWQLISYWQNSGEIPEDILEIEDSISGFEIPRDRQTDEPYTYTKTGDRTFTLCATFNKESVERRQNVNQRLASQLKGVSNWEHEAGEVCFDREIDPDLYPVREGAL